MNHIRIIVLAFFAAVLFSCQPEPNGAQLYDKLVVATNYDPDANFGAYTTFSMPTDTLGFISNTSNDTLLIPSNSDYPRPVTAAILSALRGRGYTRVPKNQNPDLGIRALVVNDLNIFQQVVYPNSYYGPGGYYSGYYGYSSWYYYPIVRTDVYKNAMLIIELIDLKNKTPDNKVKVVWAAYLGDLYGTIDLIEQTETGIEQAFIQSPYLTKSQQ